MPNILTKRKDIFYLENTGGITLTYILKKLSNCTEYLDVYTDTIEAGEEAPITVSLDGEYLLSIVGEETEDIYFTYYLELQASIIENIYDTICDCDCSCKAKILNLFTHQNSCELLMTRAKIDLYKAVTYPSGDGFFSSLLRQSKCLLARPVYCSVTQDTILGNSACDEKLLKQLMALDYLGMYFYEKVQEDDLEFIADKFNTEKIFCCIQDLGLDIVELEQTIQDQMGTFTINSGIYVNLPPSNVGDNEIDVLNRAVTFLTLAMFSVGYTDPEGNPIEEVRIDTLPIDGTLYTDRDASSVPTQINDVFTATQINDGELKFVSPNQDPIDVDSFNFSLKDTGSGLFSS